MRLLRTCEMEAGQTPKRLARETFESDESRIDTTSALVNLARPFFSRDRSRDGTNPFANAWRILSRRLRYSRFSRRLSSLMPFLWLTSFPSGRGPKKASATSWCTYVRCPRPSATWRYPDALPPFSSYAFRRTRPSLLTSYLGSTVARHSIIMPPLYHGAFL